MNREETGQEWLAKVSNNVTERDRPPVSEDRSRWNTEVEEAALSRAVAKPRVV
jgi:hypothetical protein